MAAKFVLKGDGRQIGRSPMYDSKRGCRNGIKPVARHAATAGMVLPG